MNPEEEQLGELDALEAIYPCDMEVVCRQYPEISVNFTLQSHPDDAAPDPSCAFTLQLSIRLPAQYPEEPPQLQLNGLDSLFTSRRITRVCDELCKVANENLGMPMVFTIVSTLQDNIGVLVEELRTEKVRLEMEKKEEEEAVTKKKFEGTPVTPETFLEWKRNFDVEIQAAIEKERKAREAALSGKLTGRQQFLRDASLNLSDFAVMQAEGNVEIDETLFDEDLEGLDFEDSDDEVQS